MMLADTGSTIQVSSGPFTTDGTVTIKSGGNLVSDVTYTQTGGTTQVDGTLTSHSVVLMDVSGGVVDGTGTITGLILLSGGTMEPGDAPAPGTLTIFGYDQTNAIFDELISSTANGLLTSGDVKLGPGADLNIDLLGGFTPALGQTFTIMEFISQSGAFANAPGGNFSMDGFQWFIAYEPGDIKLTFESPSGGPPVPEPSSYILLATAALAIISGGKLRASLRVNR